MDILVAHNYYKQPGGEDECVAAEISMLRANGHNVIEYFLHNDAVDGMSNLEAAAKTIWSRSSFQELRQLFRLHRPQVAHFHNTFPLISPAAYYAARSEGVRVVQTLHNFRLVCVGATLFRDGMVCEDCLGKAVAWRGVVRKCYRGSYAASAGVVSMQTIHRAMGTWRNSVDLYIALSENCRRKLLASGFPPAKVVVKPNFAFPDPGAGSGEGGYAIFVGRLSAEKGIDTLLQAWRLLDGALPLTVVGDGPLAPLVEEAAARDGSIRWLGRQPLEQTYRLIGDASVLILPSQCQETFARVAMEAFAKGTPVIAANLGAMAEIVHDGLTGAHFRPSDPADLAEKVRLLLADREKLTKMRKTARQEFCRRYTAEANHDLLISIYRKAIEENHSARRKLSMLGWT